ncbi:MAG: hypothetical protein J6A29_01310 [Clostridia bacterium]|nr:hypothetical protein [Clostridia bacterium]
MKKNFKKHSGITLIALIITIIIMLILVAVTITTAINGGLFEKAGKAVGDTKNEINAEQGLASGKIQIDGVWYDSTDDYLADTKKDTNPGVLESIGTDTYEINSIEDLVALAYSVNKGESTYLGKTIELGKNLDFKNDLSYADPQAKYELEAEDTTEIGYKPDETGTSIKELLLGDNGFIPIGTYESSGFYGTIKGNNRVIKNMKITPITTSGGLIGKTVINTQTTISDLGMEKSDINVSDYAGGILGFGYYTVEIINCYNTGTMNSQGYAGGIIGYAGYGGTTIDRCHNECNVTAKNCAGGINGYANGMSIKNCYNIGTVNSQFTVGGISGSIRGGSIKNCYSIGTVNSDLMNYIGAIIGDPGNTTITNCYYMKGSAAVGIGNSGTGEATEKEEAYMKTDAFLNELRGSIINTVWIREDNKNNGMPTFGESEKITYDNAEKDTNGFLTANAIYESDGYTAIIPKGFKVSDVAEEQAIGTGLVIKDASGNEFVWIPVKYSLKSSYSYSSNYSEPKELTSTWSDSTNTTKPKYDSQEILDELYGKDYYNYEEDFKYADEYAKMVRSVSVNDGFYIGRYETTIDNEGNIGSKYNTTVLTSGTTYTYNSTTYYYRWYGLYYAQKNANVTGNGEDVQTAMIYGVLWDKAMDFIRTQKAAGKTTYDVDKVTYSWHKTSVVNSGQANPGATGDVALNIWDLESNATEWIQEAESSNLRVFRGGFFGQNNYASHRNSNVPITNVTFFTSRLALYIK